MKYTFEVSSQRDIHLRVMDDHGQVLQDIPRVVTLREACRILRRSRRHLYRYIQKGWLTPAAKFSGEFFFHPQDIASLRGGTDARQRTIPRRLTPLFPEYDHDHLHLTRDADLILSRILEQGDTAAVKWILKHFPRSRRRLFLKTQGRRLLSPRAQRFWSWLWKVSDMAPEPSWRAYGRALGGLA